MERKQQSNMMQRLLRRPQSGSLFIYVKKMKTNTFYMVVMAQIKDYQLVTKKKGTKTVPPLSSLILLYRPLLYLVLLFMRQHI